MRKLPILLAACFLVSVLSRGSSARDPVAPHPMDKVAIADCHVHMVDFLQNGAYLHNEKEVPPRVGDALPSGSCHHRLELLLWEMDRSSLSHAMICGMPFVKKWNEDAPFRSAYYLSSSSRVVRALDTDYTFAPAVEDFRKADPDRFDREFNRIYPFICGFDGTDVGAVGMIIKRIKKFPGVWKGTLQSADRFQIPSTRELAGRLVFHAQLSLLPKKHL